MGPDSTIGNTVDSTVGHTCLTIIVANLSLIHRVLYGPQVPTKNNPWTQPGVVPEYSRYGPKQTKVSSICIYL